jgi:hypothetical protein
MFTPRHVMPLGLLWLMCLEPLGCGESVSSRYWLAKSNL